MEVDERSQKKKFKMRKKIKIFVIIFVSIFLVVCLVSGIGYYKYSKDNEIVETEYESITESTGSGSSTRNALTKVNPRMSFLNSIGDEVAYITHTGDIGGVGNLTFDSPTFHVDSTTNRVGIGTTSPSQKLDVDGSVLASNFYISDTTKEAPSKTTAAWDKSIGSGGDYANWNLMEAAMPDFFAHASTITIKTGTTLNEYADIKNKHGITSAGSITVVAEDYFPQSGAIPTASSATSTTLVDSTQSWDVDRFIDCWVFIVDGTGTDNGFVKITDSDATSVTVASWTTQPDNSSRYIIVGALITGGSYGFWLSDNTLPLRFYGIGIYDVSVHGIYSRRNSNILYYYCGIYNSGRSGLYSEADTYFFMRYCGIVESNSGSSSSQAGVVVGACNSCRVQDTAFSDNLLNGVYVQAGSFFISYNNFGDNNGLWGVLILYDGNVNFVGTQATGSSGTYSFGYIVYALGGNSGQWNAAYTHIPSTGASHSYINQAVTTTSNPTFGALTVSTIDTGYGANELWDMNQHVLTTSNVQFGDINFTGLIYGNGSQLTGITITESDPLWTGNYSNVAFKNQENVFAEQQNFTSGLNSEGNIDIWFD